MGAGLPTLRRPCPPARSSALAQAPPALALLPPHRRHTGQPATLPGLGVPGAVTASGPPRVLRGQPARPLRQSLGFGPAETGVGGCK